MVNDSAAIKQSPDDQPVSVHITNWAVNKFLGLWHICYHPDTSPENPPEKLRELLENAQKLTDGIYVNERWLFLIISNELFDLVRIPVISDHAKKRLHERFGYSGSQLEYLVVSEIYAGRRVSQKETHRLHSKYRKDAKIKIIKYKNHAYFLSEDACYALVTVLKTS
ncbi:MAG: hypothetical protein AAB766_01485 [Patescibacteria group bacterium]